MLFTVNKLLNVKPFYNKQFSHEQCWYAFRWEQTKLGVTYASAACKSQRVQRVWGEASFNTRPPPLTPHHLSKLKTSHHKGHTSAGIHGNSQSKIFNIVGVDWRCVKWQHQVCLSLWNKVNVKVRLLWSTRPSATGQQMYASREDTSDERRAHHESSLLCSVSTQTCLFELRPKQPWVYLTTGTKADFLWLRTRLSPLAQKAPVWPWFAGTATNAVTIICFIRQTVSYK